MREGVDLKERVSVLQTTLHAKKTETEASQEKLRETQMELTEYKEIAEQACSENVLLKNQVRHQCVLRACSLLGEPVSRWLVGVAPGTVVVMTVSRSVERTPQLYPSLYIHAVYVRADGMPTGTAMH